ncbi:hypothetical protein EIP91_001803 [Steccherinum ochraceum]|uniref:Tet-like 2OG-Fe(II) oxygenase domain-containing protein n=1 Tax=Steccherinum ochraceum TaxID=92696 RepID=A0A4R0RU82_9APHY|nr:hypothetical protein EIP91_001803 [Steccherinum ochraceum]
MSKIDRSDDVQKGDIIHAAEAVRVFSFSRNFDALQQFGIVLDKEDLVPLKMPRLLTEQELLGGLEEGEIEDDTSEMSSQASSSRTSSLPAKPEGAIQWQRTARPKEPLSEADEAARAASRKRKNAQALDRRVKRLEKKTAAEESEKERLNEQRREQERVKALEEAVANIPQRIQDALSEAFQSLFNTPDVHIHFVEKNLDVFQRIRSLEALSPIPIASTDPGFPRDQILWISAPGLHYFFDQETKELIFACRITPWDRYDEVTLEGLRKGLKTLMKYTDVGQPIKTNSAQKGTTKDAPPVHATGEVQRSTREIRGPPPRGSMYAIGWHNLQETDKSLGWFEETLKELPHVASIYREDFFSLMPGAAQSVAVTATKLGIPSYDTLVLDGSDPAKPFMNALTVTAFNFSNFSHVDNDWSPMVYGKWWAGTVDGNFDDDIDHDKIKGGEFLIPLYAFAIDLPNCRGMVENFWRGSQDHHVTLRSSSIGNATRFGSSIQFTKKGVQAVQRFHENDDSLKRVVDAFQRVKNRQRMDSRKRR